MFEVSPKKKRHSRLSKGWEEGMTGCTNLLLKLFGKINFRMVVTNLLLKLFGKINFRMVVESTSN